MPSRHPSIALLSLVLLGGAGHSLAQDDAKEKVSPEKVEEVVDARAREERKEEEKKPEGADPGESSYNVSDCRANWKGERAGSGDSSGSDPDAIEECEDIDK